MDVPVALAIGLAYSVSAWATIRATGEVYFDAVSMLTFFLLLGRFLEMRVRYRNELLAGEVAQLIPLTALRLRKQAGGLDTGDTEAKGDLGVEGEDYSREEGSYREEDYCRERVPIKSLCPGDVIQIGEGERLPVDGVVLSGESGVVEAVLTGEQHPLTKRAGDMVSAGTVNTTNRLEIRVSGVGKATRLAAILDMLDGTMADKPHQLEVVDRLAGWFVAAVLVLAAVVFGTWYVHDPDRALWVTLSVLVVTCPCALSLATPVALAAATGRLQRQGFLIRRGHVLQTLSRVTRVILDKTGTLTTGNLELQQVIDLQQGEDFQSPTNALSSDSDLASEQNELGLNKPSALNTATALDTAAALDPAAVLDIAAAASPSSSPHS